MGNEEVKLSDDGIEGIIERFEDFIEDTLSKMNLFEKHSREYDAMFKAVLFLEEKLLTLKMLWFKDENFL